MRIAREAKVRGSYRLYRERRGVLVAALQSEREEETRDRAERGSVVRGSDQASVAAKRTPTPTDRAMNSRSKRLTAEN